MIPFISMDGIVRTVWCSCLYLGGLYICRDWYRYVYDMYENEARIYNSNIFATNSIPFPFSFVFVLSSCRFPYVSCIAFFAFLFASLLSLVADSVILSRCYNPPRCFFASLHVCVFPSFPFPISIWTLFVSSCLFLVGILLSPRFRFMLRLV